MNNNNIFAGYYTATLRQSTLPSNFSGATNKISLINALPNNLVSLINQSDLYAFIGCEDQRGELVRIVKGSYFESEKSLSIIRGQSKYANNGMDDNSIIDLGSVPRDIKLNFGVINPGGLQKLSDLVNGLIGYDSSILRTLLPPATQSQIGGIRVAYQSIEEDSNFIPIVMPTNANAHRELYKAVYGDNSISYQTGQLTEVELNKINTLNRFFKWLTDNPNRLDTIITLINVLLAEPSKLNDIID